MEPRIWLIAGPTASGKSALALDLAREVGGEVVNADSMQVYADLRVLTARPSPEEEAQAPHHLFGIADAADPWSVGRWLRSASEVLATIAARGRSAVVVGGTGLYFRALTQGLADVPPVPPEVRREAAARFEAAGEAAFRAELRGLDPEAEGRIAAGDRQRLVRAFEVAAATGRPLSAWQAATRPAIEPGAWRGVVLEPPRPALYARCDARFDSMLGGGALDEVRALAARRLDPAVPAMGALGMRELSAHLAGELSLEEAAARARQATRNYAKRQLTWFRNQASAWPRVAAAEAADQRRNFAALRSTA